MKQNCAPAGQNERADRSSRYLTTVVDIFVILILTGQLLVYENYYYNILEVKYFYFWVCTVGMLALVALYGAVCLVRRMRRPQAKSGKGRPQVKSGTGNPKSKPGDETPKSKSGTGKPEAKRGIVDVFGRLSLGGVFSATDVMVLCFLVVVTVSMLISPFQYEAMWGNEGRYTGAFMFMLCVGIYFCVSRFYKVKGWHIQLFLVSGMLMCLFGITDYFNMDLLHFKVNIEPTQRQMFTSFIGNINTYTACVALVMGMAGVLFASCTGVLENIWYGFCVTVAFVAIIMGQSDNSYLSLAAFFGLLPLYLFRSFRGFRKYIVLLALFVTSLVGIGWTQTAYEGVVVRLVGLFGVVMRFPRLGRMAAGLWVLAVLLYAAELGVKLWREKGGNRTAKQSVQKPSEQKPSGQRPAWAARAWWLVIGAAVAVIAFMIYDATFAGHADRYGALAPYVTFGDSWGTHRGYIWRIAVEDYMKFPPLQKLFGYGPDTFGLVTWYNNMPEMIDLYHERFDSVHNEFLQLFVTIGPLGLLSYLGIHLTAVWHVVKRRLDNPYIVGAMFAVVCYNFQAVVNINQPIAMPVMWLLLCISMAQPAKPRQRPQRKAGG